METFEINLLEIQPSQLYICADKLAKVRHSMRESRAAWPEPLPVKRLGEQLVLADGHTRAFAAFQDGRRSVRASWETDELDWEAYEICVQWCVEEGIHSIADLQTRIITADQYEALWYERCRALHRRLAGQRAINADRETT